MNIAYLYENEIHFVLITNTNAYSLYAKISLQLELNKYSCRQIKINKDTKYSKIMKLEASLSSTFNFLESIYNINNYLILKKSLTGVNNFTCKLLLRSKKKFRSLKLHPKPK